MASNSYRVLLFLSCLLSGFMTSLCNAAFWISLIAVNQVSPVLVSSPFNISGTLLFFAAVSFANLMFILLAVPETKVGLL